jgi:hypothetical protein
VLERGRLIRLDGPLVRTLYVNLDEAMKEALDSSGSEVIRIAGAHTTDFRRAHTVLIFGPQTPQRRE